MKDAPKGPYVYQPYGPASHPELEDRIYGVSGLRGPAIRGVTRKQADQILAEITASPVIKQFAEEFAGHFEDTGEGERVEVYLEQDTGNCSCPNGRDWLAVEACEHFLKDRPKLAALGAMRRATMLIHPDPEPIPTEGET